MGSLTGQLVVVHDVVRGEGPGYVLDAGDGHGVFLGLWVAFPWHPAWGYVWFQYRLRCLGSGVGDSMCPDGCIFV